MPPPSPRHLRLLRLLLSGLVLGAALRGAAAGRSGERRPGQPAAGRPGVGGRRVGLRPRGATLTLPAATAASLVWARRPRRPRRPSPRAAAPASPGPARVNSPRREGRGAGPPRDSSGRGFSRLLGGEPEVHPLLVFVWVREPVGRCRRRAVSERAAAWSRSHGRLSVRASPVPAGLPAGGRPGAGAAALVCPCRLGGGHAPRFAAVAASEVSRASDSSSQASGLALASLGAGGTHSLCFLTHPLPCRAPAFRLLCLAVGAPPRADSCREG